ncbi:energy-coupling factor ABC transporter ATP-binding protein [Raoultibacter phocaeensis]|uniref:energy-coupling factor ABC transporter ATP-binding protein n=1 Tax=Raoultibacter phocaeensis TaxID=2479841 RepID=UPI001C55BBC2|nr:ABC transporter ATP-binding protein [Raoultibacter phocaeensis]
MTAETKPIITVENVSFTYDGSDKRALDAIDLSVGEGDFLGIIGESGAGKSTLLYSMNGIIPHYCKGDFYGSVALGGNDTFETSLTDLSRKAATVFQDIDAQMVASVVEDEILFGLENFGVAKGEIEARLAEALDRVGIADLRTRAISSLSGGQKQKVAVAAVLALKPQVLLLDEPTGALDPASSRQIFELLRELNESHGITVVVVEQKIGLLAEFAKRLAVLADGKLAYCGATRDVLRNAAELLAIGVNVPRVTTLSVLLHEKGYAIERFAVNVDEAKDMIEGIVA